MTTTTTTTTNSAIANVHAAMDAIYLQLGKPITTLIIAGNEPSKSKISAEYKRACRKATTAAGTATINCGDEYAIMFEGMKLQDIADAASQMLSATGKPITTLIIAGNEPSKSKISAEYKRACRKATTAAAE